MLVEYIYRYLWNIVIYVKGYRELIYNYYEEMCILQKQIDDYYQTKQIHIIIDDFIFDVK